MQLGASFRVVLCPGVHPNTYGNRRVPHRRLVLVTAQRASTVLYVYYFTYIRLSDVQVVRESVESVTEPSCPLASLSLAHCVLAVT